MEMLLLKRLGDNQGRGEHLPIGIFYHVFNGLQGVFLVLVLLVFHVFSSFGFSVEPKANKQPSPAIEGAGWSKVVPLYLSCLQKHFNFLQL